jgi:uncharacterized protein (TIGR02145 family)
MRPRYGRFAVRTDLTGNLLPSARFGAAFSVTPEAGKYGDLEATAVRIVVPPYDMKFHFFWWRSSFDDGSTYPWSVTRHTNETHNYVFPWNATHVDFDVRSNVGSEFDNTESDTGNGDLKASGSGTPDTEGNVQYPYSFLFRNDNFNQPHKYSFVFNTTEAFTKETYTLEFIQGVQIWQRTDPASAQTAIGYAGLTPAKFVDVTGNVKWNTMVSFSPENDNDWLKLDINNEDNYRTPTSATAMVRDDRKYAPEAFADDYIGNAAVRNTVLINNTTLHISIANVDELNTGWEKREATISFSNLDMAVTGASANSPITVTQWAPVLTHSSNNLPIGSNQIPAASENVNYWVEATTNLQGWGVKVYSGDDNSSTALTTQLFGNDTAINANDKTNNHRMSFIVPENENITARTVSVYLYCMEFYGKANEIRVGTWSQEAVAITLSVTPENRRFNNTINGGGSQDFTVDTNSPTWTVTNTDNVDWITIPTDAQSGKTFSVSVISVPESTTERSATLTVTAGGQSQNVTVVQDGLAPTLTVSPDTQLIDGTGTRIFTVIRDPNSNFSVVSSAPDWATVPSGAQSGNNLTVTIIQANMTGATRTANIDVTSNGITRRVTVTQRSGAIIGNVRWATGNLTGYRQTAANQQAVGAFFQWGTLTSGGAVTAYSATNPGVGVAVSGWNGTSLRHAWTTANNPCPNGWRLPTQTEANALGNGVWTNNWNSTGAAGRLYTINGMQVFLRNYGYRQHNNGQLNTTAHGTCYWTSTTPPNEAGNAIRIRAESGAGTPTSAARSSGCAIRCVQSP